MSRINAADCERRLSQFFGNARQLRFELLIDHTVFGFHATTAATDRGIRYQPDGRYGGMLVEHFLNLPRQGADIRWIHQ
jgi:hypothetical protein